MNVSSLRVQPRRRRLRRIDTASSPLKLWRRLGRCRAFAQHQFSWSCGRCRARHRASTCHNGRGGRGEKQDRAEEDGRSEAEGAGGAAAEAGGAAAAAGERRRACSSGRPAELQHHRARSRASARQGRRPTVCRGRGGRGRGRVHGTPEAPHGPRVRSMWGLPQEKQHSLPSADGRAENNPCCRGRGGRGRGGRGRGAADGPPPSHNVLST